MKISLRKGGEIQYILGWRTSKRIFFTSRPILKEKEIPQTKSKWLNYLGILGRKKIHDNIWVNTIDFLFLTEFSKLCFVVEAKYITLTLF